jgi:hypothetical protein
MAWLKMFAHIGSVVFLFVNKAKTVTFFRVSQKERDACFKVGFS